MRSTPEKCRLSCIVFGELFVVFLPLFYFFKALGDLVCFNFLPFDRLLEIFGDDALRSSVKLSSVSSNSSYNRFVNRLLNFGGCPFSQVHSILGETRAIMGSFKMLKTLFPL